ncbi:MAG: type II/IV secretion system protein [Nitrospirae bacterium]|nr:type II/IV secretion system protein [Nitrospirota bacterium]
MKMNESTKLGEILIEKKIITTAQLEEALKKMQAHSLPLGEMLVRLKFVSEHVMLDTLSKHLGVDFLNIAENDYQIVDRALSRVLPLEICEKQKVLPIYQIIDEDLRELTLAMANPFDEEIINEVASITECRVNPVLATIAAIEGGIAKLYAIKTDIKIEKFSMQKGDPTSLVNGMLQTAVRLGASDIHIDPHPKEVFVRMRVDGILEVVSVYPIEMHPSVSTRIKVMASAANSNMKIEERRLPQDGAITGTFDSHIVDCRVSTLPSIFGEKIVMRIFDKDKAAYIGRIRDLKMSPRMELKYRRCVRHPSGINIVTGPTGSGKTTTLHAVINEISSVGISVVTVEDPVEYQAGGYINQSSLIPAAGYTYTRALRAIMRQDPDVILIGEVRDRETAEIATQAALTGHRVFTTLHTDNAASSFARLIDIGVEHFLVSSTTVSSLNQRLIRKVCTNCAEEHIPTKVELADIGIDNEVISEILKNPQQFSMRRGKGCDMCRKTGYRGRQGVYELIAVTPDIRELIHRNKSTDVIATTAREKDNVNMIFEEGLRLFLTGVTTLGEMQHLPRGDYKMKSVEEILKDSELS